MHLLLWGSVRPKMDFQTEEQALWGVRRVNERAREREKKSPGNDLDREKVMGVESCEKTGKP